MFFRSDLIGYYLAAIRKRLVQWCIVPKVVETEITSVYRSKWYHSCFLLIQCPFWPWIREKKFQKTVLDLRWSSLRFVSPPSNHLTVIWKMFVQVARNQLIWANWKTSYKHSYCISSSICRHSCKSRDKKHKSDRELVIECLDRTIKLIESSGVGSPSLSRQYRKDLESCLFKASIQICLSLLFIYNRENGQVCKTAQITDQLAKIRRSQYNSDNWRCCWVWGVFWPECKASQ